jgi:serine/threonine protein kinase
MRSPVAFLKCVAKALVKYGGNAAGLGFAGDLLVEVLPELVGDIWNHWSAQRDERGRREELQVFAQAAPAEVHAAAAAVVAEAAPNRPPAERQALAGYLLQVQATVRRAFRRPSDPSGTTVPPNLPLRQARDLYPLLPTKPARFKPGDRPLAGIDWELEELLGVGGFGEVWKARNPHFPGVAPVALKFCLDAGAKERLLRHEAAVLDRVMRQGRHEGIVQLQHTYLGVDPPCLAYEYVPGGDLTGLILEWHRQRGGLTPADAARVIDQLARIMAFAHRLSPPIVHRDLKPANILVQPDNGRTRFKVADFGIGGLAAAQAIRESTRRPTRTEFFTAAAHGAYTPLYASPQQMAGEPPDPRDDVYALGVIWYQLLTGELSAGAPSGLQWPQRLKERGMREEAVHLLAACFEPRADDRPADAAALHAALTRLTPADPPPAAVPARPAPAAVTPAPPVAAIAAAPPLDEPQLVETPGLKKWLVVAGGVLFALVLLISLAVWVFSDSRTAESTKPTSREKNGKFFPPPGVGNGKGKGK